MKHVVTPLILAAVCSLNLDAADPYQIDDTVMGIYEGNWQAPMGRGRLEVQVRSLGNNRYDGAIFAYGREVVVDPDSKEVLLSAAVMQPFEHRPGQSSLVYARHPEAGVRDGDERTVKLTEMNFRGTFENGAFDGTITGGFLTDTTWTAGKANLPESPTMGAQPGSDGWMVFDGGNTDEWAQFTWKKINGAMEVGSGNITTKKELESFLLHVEFRTPFMPEARGQQRGNSGVYIQSKIEVQVLDSFGLFPLQNNDCGGIYQVSAPNYLEGNACLPPGTWQTYDITYRAGSVSEQKPAYISVVHNGKTILRNIEIPVDKLENGTGGGNPDGGFLMLQDHGNPVQYRNIWVQPIE